MGGGGGGGGGGYQSGTGGGGGFGGCGGGGGGGAGTSYAAPAATSTGFGSAENPQSADGWISIDLGPAGTTQTYTSTASGDYQTFTVPAGVTSLHITVAGGSGGAARSSPGSTGFKGGIGGSGGRVTATVPVTPGQVLSLWVGRGGQTGGTHVGPVHQVRGAGAQGNPAGSAYNGGNGGTCNGDPVSCTGLGDAGGGGSAGYVLAGGVPLVVAGGGGGGAATGGSTSATDNGPGGNGGRGGRPASPGERRDYKGFAGGAGGGTGNGNQNGSAGASSSNTANPTKGGPGGGGGGGCDAGGGGGVGSLYPATFGPLHTITGGGGGGGGSSCVAPAATGVYYTTAGNQSATDSDGNAGWISISYRQATTTTISSSANPAAPGTAVTYTATVSAGGGVVNFTSDGRDIAGCGRAVVHPGQATCTTTDTFPGSHPIAATYLGDETHAPSSASLTQLIDGYANTATLTSSDNPASVGQAITFELTGFASTGTGTVSFTAGGTTIAGCGPMPVSHRSSGGAAWFATCTTSSLALGSHTVTGTYSGDALFAPATSSITQGVFGPLDRIVLSPQSSTVSLGTGQTYRAQGFDAAGNDLGDVTSTTTFSIGPDGSCGGATCSPANEGAHTVTATNGPATATAALDAVQIYFVVVHPREARIRPGASQTYWAEGFNRFFDSLGDVTSSTTFSIGPDGSCTGNVCTASEVGDHTVRGVDGIASGAASLQVVPVVSLEITPRFARIAPGGSQTYEVHAEDEFGNDLGDVSSATSFSIIADGSCSGATCTAAHEGLHLVTATYGSVSVTVQLQVVPVASLVLSPASATIPAGGSQAYRAQGFDAEGNDLGDVTGSTTFSIGPGGSCTGTTCTATTVGDHTVTGVHSVATTTDTASGTATLQVGPGAVDHLVLSPAGATMTAGGSQDYRATAVDRFGNDLGDVTGSTTFSVGPEGSCTGATCTASAVGDHTVTGTSGSATGTATLAVTAGALDHLVLSPSVATITAGGSQAYGARGFDVFGNDLGDVTGSTTFSVGPEGSCTGATCSASAAGGHTVTGTIGSATGAASLSVTAGPLDHLELTPSTASIVAGETQAYGARGFDAFGNDLGDVTGSTTFSIGPDGACAAATCTASAAGGHTVTGTNGSATGTASLAVTAGVLDHLVLSPEVATITAGGSQVYGARGFDVFGNDLGDLTDTTTFTLSPEGSCTGSTCTASRAGEHTVTGTNGSATGTALVAVTAGALDRLVLSPATATIAAGDTQTYLARGFDAAGNDLGDLTETATFSIGPDGSCTGATCTASAAGEHTVTGTIGSVTGTAMVTVTAGPLARLDVSPATASLVAGESQAYLARGFDAA
ncbi:MAG TPA: Ig-like domain repeat protein, partial [Iamia sp.]